MEKSASNVILWLIKNDYYHSLTKDLYIKDVGIRHLIRMESIYDDPAGVVKRVEFFHTNYSNKLIPWDSMGFISQDDDDDILKPAAKTSGYLSPSAYRASKNTPWDYEPPETFIPDYTPPKTCSHEWAKYVGLNEAFEYCKKCDEKKK